MATYRKRNGSINVAVMIGGKRKSATFGTKREARDWAAEAEVGLKKGEVDWNKTATLADGIDKYMREEEKKDEPTEENVKGPLVRKKSHVWMRGQYKLMAKYPIAQMKMCDIEHEHIYAFQESRLALGKKNGTVDRELFMYSSVMTRAVKKWKWIAKNCILTIDKLPPDPHRERTLTSEEIARMLEELGYKGTTPETDNQKTAVLFLLALSSAMRLGEMCKITPEDIDWERRSVRLRKQITKGGKVREVPLSVESLRLMRLANFPLNIKSTKVTILFLEARIRSGIENLRFHDSRHHALTKMGKIRGMSVIRLAKISGHTTIKQLMVYLNETISDLADILDAGLE